MTSMFKFDVSKVKARLEEQKQKLEEAKNKKGGFKERDIHSEIILKVDKAGEYNFRAFPYIHNDDFLSDPFPDRYYHFGVPGVGTVFCPQSNTGRREKCAICDFVWEQMKANKGNKPEIKKWSERLPKRRLLIPGILRGREEEGVKFFSLSTHNEKPSDNHEQILKWLQKESTCDFLDPVNGLDLILHYEEYDEAKSKMLSGAKFGFNKIELDRDRVPISKNPEEFWAEIESTLINVDRDIPGFEIKSYDDTVEALTKWMEALDKKEKKSKSFKPVNEKKDSTDSGVVADTKKVDKEVSQDRVVSDDEKPVVAEPPVKTESKATMTAEERKARAKELLRKNASA